jgi:hypothetical protein
MQSRTISTKQFLAGEAVRPQGLGTHRYSATLNGKRITVTDEDGHVVEVEYGGTSDNRTVYARVPGVGLIGGWQYPHRAMPWHYLARSINRHVLYHRMEDLPKRATVKPVTCPHCGNVFEA